MGIRSWNKATILFSISILIFICAKLWFRQADNDSLLFLLAPTSYFVELFTGNKAFYSIGLGYYYQSLNITIDKSCSGFNFLLISFLMITYILGRVKQLNLALSILVSILLAYLVTILANVSRIVTYTVLMRQDIPNLVDPQNIWLHRAEGILVYLSFLILLYLSLNQTIIKLIKHEKPIKS